MQLEHHDARPQGDARSAPSGSDASPYPPPIPSRARLESSRVEIRPEREAVRVTPVCSRTFALGNDEESALWLWARSRHDPLAGDAGDEPIDGWPSAGQLLADRLVALIG